MAKRARLSRGAFPAGTFPAALAVALFSLPRGSRLRRTRIPSDSGTVNFLIEASPTNLDPRIGTDAQSAHIDGLIFDSLVAHDAQMKIIPDLALSWDTPDPLTYIFHLRPGVKFHDGRPLTSADVKFTFDSILSGAVRSPKRGGFKMVISVEAPDEATVVFHLKQPYASLLCSISAPGIGIVPQGSGPELSQHPIGTGPFRFVSEIPDEEIILEQNENYFAGVPKIKKLRIRIVPDAIVRALELRKGSADATINSLTPDMSVTLAKEPGLAADEQPGTTLAYMSFNLEDPILAQARSAPGARLRHRPRHHHSLFAARPGAPGGQPAAAESLGL